jgi:hypothetical protein
MGERAAKLDMRPEIGLLILYGDSESELCALVCTVEFGLMSTTTAKETAYAYRRVFSYRKFL